jgi:pimeloyl-ACP methyl ester carboxylesterase
MNENDWFKKGRFKLINGHKIFVIDTGLDSDEDKDITLSKPYLCLLHGFPTSSYDYFKVLDSLSIHFRVVVHDHLGFGFSDKPLDYSYSLIEQTDIALKLWQEMTITDTAILAHDYGTSILTEILARDNQGFTSIKINQIILCNGSMHIELAKLRLIQRLLRNQFVGHLVARLASKNTMARNLKNIYHEASNISEQEIESIWYLMNKNQGNKVLAKISRYTFERKKFWHRWIGALQKTRLPIEIIWPDKDPIAVKKMAEVIKQETKNSRLYWLHDCGHFPMLEAPKLWCETVLSALGKKNHEQ